MKRLSLGHHKATPQVETEGVSTCVHCGRQITKVPGGQGPKWIHEDGYVVGHGAPREPR